MPVGLGTRATLLTRIAVAMYAIFLVTVPFEHHDLQCELRTPLHCTACATTALASGAPHTDVSGQWHLPDAGRAVTHLIALQTFLLDIRSTGRAPPVSA